MNIYKLVYLKQYRFMKMNKTIFFALSIVLSLFFVACDDSTSSSETTKGLTPAPEKGGKLDPSKNPFMDKAKPEIKKPTGPVADMTFPVDRHDFGTIKQNEKHTHIFKFKNDSENPLMIESARGSCGCTVPKYPKEPIAPGAEGEIEVVFSSGKKKGKQNKTVTIVSNTNPVQTKLTIEAFIEVEKEEKK